MPVRSLNRREWIRFFGGGVAALAVSRGPFAAPEDSPARRFNVLFLLAADQRFDTIHSLGNEIIQTPGLDALVQRGTAFTHAFAPIPVSASSRAAILTGCDGFRSGVRGSWDTMDPKLQTWPQIMAASGYVTCYIGQWVNDHRPEDRGFQQVRHLSTGVVSSQVMKFDEHGKTVEFGKPEEFSE